MSEESNDTPKFVLPTSVAVERYLQMKVESILNTEYQVTDGKTPLEHCLRGDQDAQKTVALLDLPSDQADVATELLEDALEGGEVEEIFGIRGGILNLLFPAIDESDDFNYQAADEDYEKYVNMPNECFSSLTPAQVWAGAGKIEMELADEFLQSSWEELRETSYPSPGAANTEWLSKLRLWAYNPSTKYRGRIVDVITAERNINFRKRHVMAEELDLELDFELVEVA